jgi:hypothetical protein
LNCRPSAAILAADIGGNKSGSIPTPMINAAVAAMHSPAMPYTKSFSEHHYHHPAQQSISGEAQLAAGHA